MKILSKQNRQVDRLLHNQTKLSLKQECNNQIKKLIKNKSLSINTKSILINSLNEFKNKFKRIEKLINKGF